jgi:hypothetical protein
MGITGNLQGNERKEENPYGKPILEVSEILSNLKKLRTA